MRNAILDAAQFGRTSGMAALIVRTRQINGMLGTHLAPWELQELPEDWLTALELWVDGYPKARAWVNEIEAAKARTKSRMVH